MQAAFLAAGGHSGRLQPGRLTRQGCLWMAVALAGALPAGTAHAQARQQVPSQAYFLAFKPYFDGDYVRALRVFRDAARGGVRSTLGVWIDSICYHAMAGECHYQMGDLAAALEQYDAALQVFLANRDWMRRVQFPPAVGPSPSRVRATITWATSSRPSSMGHFADTMPLLRGRLDNERVLQEGGVISNPFLHPVYVHEVVRCTALALRRRMELLGPLCPHDRLSAELMGALAARPGPLNHWAGAWISVQLGLAYAGEGRTAEAINELQSSVLVAGQYDHPLTATAQLELGKLALAQGQMDAAATHFLDATIAAAEFDQVDLMDEAFRYGLTVHLLANKQQLYPPLVAAAQWAAQQRLQQLYASLLIMAAENQAALRQTQQAQQLLEQARRAMGRREMTAGRVGGRFQYQLAHVQYQQGDVAAGDTALTAAIQYQRRSSLGLFHIAMADRLYEAGTITPRTAEAVYASVLREPAGPDWAMQPMETLTLVMTPQPKALENWFHAAWDRQSPETALEIGDLRRRRRFFATLPMGGRLLALRWILDAPSAVLPKSALLERQELLLRYPQYAQLTKDSESLRQALAELPLGATDADALQRQAKIAGQLDQISTAQETILCEMALSRQASTFVFPPRHTTKEIQQALGPGQLALIYVATSRAVYAFMLSNETYAHWQGPTPARLKRDVGTLLRGIGQVDENKPVPDELIRDERWKAPAQALLGQLVEQRQHGFWNKFPQLIIVPDDVLWHVPFEALQIPSADGSEPLGAKVRVRYLPVASLIVSDQRGPKPAARTAVVVGRLYPGDDPQIAADALAAIEGVLPGATAIGTSPAPTGLLRIVWDRLIVLDDITDLDRGPLGWCPTQLDKGKPGGTLSRWLKLPWGGPEQIVLPGFKTAAASGLKRPADDTDMFLATCGLMACGARTILISRWRTGGQTSFDLLREYLQELPHLGAADAWHRSVQLARSTPIDLAREPRVSQSAQAEPMTADHPFFWAGYVVVDSVGQPKPEPAQ